MARPDVDGYVGVGDDREVRWPDPAAFRLQPPPVLGCLRRRSSALAQSVRPTRVRIAAPPMTTGMAPMRRNVTNSSAHVGSSPIVLPLCSMDTTTRAGNG